MARPQGFSHAIGHFAYVFRISPTYFGDIKVCREVGMAWAWWTALYTCTVKRWFTITTTTQQGKLQGDVLGRANLVILMCSEYRLFWSFGRGSAQVNNYLGLYYILHGVLTFFNGQFNTHFSNCKSAFNYPLRTTLLCRTTMARYIDSLKVLFYWTSRWVVAAQLEFSSDKLLSTFQHLIRVVLTFESVTNT